MLKICYIDRSTWRPLRQSRSKRGAPMGRGALGTCQVAIPLKTGLAAEKNVHATYLVPGAPPPIYATGQ